MLADGPPQEPGQAPVTPETKLLVNSLENRAEPEVEVGVPTAPPRIPTWNLKQSSPQRRSEQTYQPQPEAGGLE